MYAGGVLMHAHMQMCGDGAGVNELGGVCVASSSADIRAMAETRGTTATHLDSVSPTNSDPGRDH